jgi:ribonuclease HII
MTLVEFDIQARSRNGSRFLFGVDEAGRGPLAGPVVAAAVCLRDTDFTVRVGDSKKLSARQRDKAFDEILTRAWVGVGVVDALVIDEINILNATHRAMTCAVKELVSKMPFGNTKQDDFASVVTVLIDGNSYKGDIPYKIETVVAGDDKSLSIACASIMAKVTRDRIIEKYDRLYPQYGFKEHKGYPTAQHAAAIRTHGFCPIHRRTFRVPSL